MLETFALGALIFGIFIPGLVIIAICVWTILIEAVKELFL